MLWSPQFQLISNRLNYVQSPTYSIYLFLNQFPSSMVGYFGLLILVPPPYIVRILSNMDKICKFHI